MCTFRRVAPPTQELSRRAARFSSLPLRAEVAGVGHAMTAREGEVLLLRGIPQGVIRRVAGDVHRGCGRVIRPGFAVCGDGREESRCWVETPRRQYRGTSTPEQLETSRGIGV